MTLCDPIKSWRKDGRVVSRPQYKKKVLQPKEFVDLPAGSHS